MPLPAPKLILGAALLSIGAVAIAQPPAPPAHGQPVNRAELKNRLETRFDAADANKDGTVTPAERKARRAEARDAMRERMFTRLDTDKNGTISKAEFNAPRDGRAAGEPRSRQRDRMAGAMPGRDHMKRHRFAAHRDQPITRSQFVDAGLSRFDRVDTDHDGKITPAERDAARKAMRDRLVPAQSAPPPSPGK